MEKIEYIKIDECKFIGVAIRQNIHGNNNVPEFWEELKNNGTLHLLESVQEKVFKNAMLGWMGNYDDKTKEFDYCIGVLTKSQDVQGIDQDQFKIIDIPGCLLAVGTIEKGPGFGHSNNKKMYERDGYVLDSRKGFEIEYYEGEKGSGIFRYITPVRKPD